MSAIFVSAGHSNVDSGAVANGRKEADIAVEFRNMVSFYLERDHVPHFTDGKGAENWPLAKAAKEARSYDVAVEFHCNAGDLRASGVETLSATKDFVLANQICQAVSTYLGIKNRGAKPENSGQHTRLAFVQSGGIIVELFFISNKQDLAAYEAKKWIVAREIASILKGALK